MQVYFLIRQIGEWIHMFFCLNENTIVDYDHETSTKGQDLY